MKFLALLPAAMLTAFASAPAAEKDTRYYSLATVHAKAGKLAEMQTQISTRMLPLLTNQGATLHGAFVPVENPEEMVLLVFSFANAESLKKMGAALEKDPDAQAAEAEMRKLGDRTKDKTVFMSATDFSPVVAAAAGPGPRVFELRTYTTTPGNLPLLHARFRDHTLALFQKHGMTNLWYWQLAKNQPDADHTLIYLLAHASTDAAKASFAAFRADPDWIAAKAASEEKGGGSLTVPDGVKSVFLKATDYSPLK
ncbi:MAG: NIPSNAP family protein [Chthoniobacter sp.]|nr:NIPSNAP family protein [Chthoniobacter sp.]